MPRQHTCKQFIAGEWRDGTSDKTMTDHNPYTLTPIAEFTAASLDDLDDAYKAAEDTQPAWATTNPYTQRKVFTRAARYVEDHAAEITELIIDELGGTRLKAGFEISLVIDMLGEAATLPMRRTGIIAPSPVDDCENLVYRDPVGVVGVISPSNFPFFLGVKPVAAALALGNTVVLKPHEDTPITGGTLIAEVFEAAGLPPGLLNVVLTDISVIGESFVEHPVPRVIAFTGSDRVGRHIAEVAAGEHKNPLLELGGNSALIVRADADLELAVDAAVFSRHVHSGQVCMAANRVLLHRDIYDEFAERYVARVAALPVGDPRDEATVIGPLINQRQAETLTTQVSQTILQGARQLLAGGVLDPERPTLFHPVVLGDVTAEMVGAQQELFGPVTCLRRVYDDDHAVASANLSRYGLSGAIHTRNIDDALEMARRIHTGMVHINDGTIRDEPSMPFGGEKHSGLGRLNGDWSLNEFTTPKWITVNRGRPQFPF